MKNTFVSVIAIIFAVIFCFSSFLGESNNIAKAKEAIATEDSTEVAPATVYECDVKFFRLKTTINITSKDEAKYSVEGKVVRFITDPLQLLDGEGNVVAEASDTFNLISEDDHLIRVNSEEIEMKGEIALVGKKYTLYINGEQVGVLTVDATGRLGSIRDNNGGLVAEYKVNNILLLDYTLSIYANELFSDEAINMFFASYYSDLAWERSQNDSE